MPNDEHLALLLQGVVTWNTWRDHNPNIQPDLSRADLHDADLHDADLHGADLHDADLHGADLQRANLGAARLYGANLTNANLNHAGLQLADLHHANLSGVTLFHADLSSAGLIRTNFTSAFLYNTNLSGAFVNGAIFNKARFEETIFARTFLKHAIGLDDCTHFAPSIIDFHTLIRSQDLPAPFLRGCGLPDALIEYCHLYAVRQFDFIPALSATRSRTKFSPTGSMPICRIKAFDAGSRPMIFPLGRRPGMRLTRRSAFEKSCS